MNPSTASKSKPGGRKASMAATASIVVEKDENSDKMTGGDQEETILHDHDTSHNLSFAQKG